MQNNPYLLPSSNVEKQQGYNFVFDIEGHHVLADGSSFSRKEYVYVNNELVSEKQTHARKSKHEFEIEGGQYEIEFNMASITKGKLFCALEKDGKVLKKYVGTPKSEVNFLSVFFIFMIFFVYEYRPYDFSRA